MILSQIGERVAQSEANELPSIHRCRQYSNERLEKIRSFLSKQDFNNDLMIGTYGSFARREGSKQSDLDFFGIATHGTETESLQERLKALAPEILEIAGREPSPDGSFGQVITLESMLSNIGGGQDSNDTITRRVLYLLEGEWMYNEKLAASTKRNLINCYVREGITSHQLSLFLLNDIIRYYRTICVDFEFKTFQAPRRKPWGVRNVKLVFSRKLLYFSGLLAVAETAQLSYSKKIDVLEALFSMTVIDRVINVCGDHSMRALKLYDNFLCQIEKDDVRDELNKVEEARKNDSAVFRDLKDAGHHFTWELLNLLRQTYDISHPIHRAIVL